ncbi:MAG: thioredoxin-dependent thiol peroxidase [Chloroflexi bacterium]|nr:thioredoxin-dependent thiol peroxidase [Chloroflexota bacterium]MBP8058617.1 thioredoxin-dependent thiol peroxidase [Chloroflexota bacterium]
MLETGAVAPEFTLLNHKGEEVRLSDYRGRRVILFFYPRADTPGCTTQACGFRDNWLIIQEANATVLGISPDTVDVLAKWHNKMGFPYDLLADPDHKIADLYGVWGEKSMYGKTYMGILRSHFVIDAEGHLADTQVKISPEKSVEKAVKVVRREP